MDPFLGEIRAVGFNFAPQGWAVCDGSLLPISQNDALFSLLGTTYGGDGQTTFGLPDFRGRVAVGFGQGPNLSNYSMGQRGGEESVTLTTNQIASHSHLFAASDTTANSHSPTAGTFATLPAGGRADNLYKVATDTTMAPDMIQPSGQSLAHENRHPNQCLLYIIALEGIFPPQN